MNKFWSNKFLFTSWPQHRLNCLLSTGRQLNFVDVLSEKFCCSAWVSDVKEFKKYFVSRVVPFPKLWKVQNFKWSAYVCDWLFCIRNFEWMKKVAKKNICIGQLTFFTFLLDFIWKIRKNERKIWKNTNDCVWLCFYADAILNEWKSLPRNIFKLVNRFCFWIWNNFNFLD